MSKQGRVIPVPVSTDSYTKDVNLTGIALESTAIAARDAALIARDEAVLIDARLPAAPATEGTATDAKNSADSAKNSADVANNNVLGVQGGVHGYIEQDLLFWPCLSGERFAPTFMANSGYSMHKSRPSVKNVYNNGGNPGWVRWPNIPRISALTSKRVLRISASILLQGGLGSINQFGISNDINNTGGGTPSVMLIKGNGGVGFALRSADLAATEETVTAIIPVADTWYRIELILGQTFAALLIDGVERARHTVRYWAPEEAANTGSGLKLVTPNEFTGTACHAAAVKATWTAA